jgi:hypothetical protein
MVPMTRVRRERFGWVGVLFLSGVTVESMRVLGGRVFKSTINFLEM